jgi:probable HAF family extracellular repeat protein
LLHLPVSRDTLRSTGSLVYYPFQTEQRRAVCCDRTLMVSPKECTACAFPKENMKNTDRSCFFRPSTLSVGFLCLLLLSAARGQTSHTVTDLGALGGSTSFAFGFNCINNRGQVVGQSVISADTATHAFLYSDGKMQDLSKPPCP